jgi:hypothetical protein
MAAAGEGFRKADREHGAHACEKQISGHQKYTTGFVDSAQIPDRKDDQRGQADDQRAGMQGGNGGSEGSDARGDTDRSIETIIDQTG